MQQKNRFQNLDNIELTATFKDFLKWQRERKGKNKDFSFIVPQAFTKEVDFLQTNRITPTITWIGHATFLIQIGGLNILTDPLWARRMGLSKRLAEPGLKPNEVPEIDIVLISHNHYDHLDISSLRQLKGDPLHLVPMGLKPLLLRRGFKKVQELHWWERKRIKEVEFTFTPAQHWSKRALWDTNKSHWGGWVIGEVDSNSNTLYFIGDSGYFRGFKEVGKRFDIEYVLAPIGAYEPEWFMSIQHVTPEEAVKAYLDTGAKYFIPMHYDAFKLADDTPKEALERLQNEWERQQLEASKLLLLKLGETCHLDKKKL